MIVAGLRLDDTFEREKPDACQNSLYLPMRQDDSKDFQVEVAPRRVEEDQEVQEM